MTGIVFPPNPYDNQIFSANGYRWIWSGVTWDLLPTYISIVELQAIVADSTDFADFQSKIAALN